MLGIRGRGEENDVTKISDAFPKVLEQRQPGDPETEGKNHLPEAEVKSQL